ncbi:exodeoxyribonuclease VII large subunit [Virgibacillus dokdonensis]|uniref:Exodeoxyribonuclease 7 large subunit n=1 Tax=Virgibacillus dokdonensis TaxID=302167 RepID=A0A2K9J2Z9_9BACI|nr:exodeoxyribonuclease VII large subunit [Virgibacillus dokdonensis]AUJ26309.1 Exodeoxyribonuclease 7 large subunit [Virgibacillus dokdonensis]
MKDNYLTVTALTRYIKRKMDVDPHLRQVWLRGEISNFKHHSRGHMYLTIKDDRSRIQAVMFAGNNRSLKFQPENGMNVLIKGEISVFEAYGQYQLYIQQMEPDGIGALYVAFEQLKEKLEKQGYFDHYVKKNIPPLPKNIGIITSPTGAAVRDIITTIKRRYPIVELTVIPALVQGEAAARSIKQAIEIANQKGDFDLLIVGRGGGSIEELWSFNEEIVAKAIFHSNIPIISAVGHETDTTISDFVADLRAPTPTAAAEIAVPSSQDLKDKIATLKRMATKDMQEKWKQQQKHLFRLKQSYAFRYPYQLLKQKEQELDGKIEQLQKAMLHTKEASNKSYEHLWARFTVQHPGKQVERGKQQLQQLVKQQYMVMKQLHTDKVKKLHNEMDKLSLLNPLAIMKRGFSIPYTSAGQIIKSVHAVEREDAISLRLADGLLKCKVIETKEESQND